VIVQLFVADGPVVTPLETLQAAAREPLAKMDKRVNEPSFLDNDNIFILLKLLKRTSSA
jgi:hypothetical protein